MKCRKKNARKKKERNMMFIENFFFHKREHCNSFLYKVQDFISIKSVSISPFIISTMNNRLEITLKVIHYHHNNIFAL